MNWRMVFAGMAPEPTFSFFHSLRLLPPFHRKTCSWPPPTHPQAPRTPLGTVAGPAGAGLLPSPGTLLATAAPGGTTGLSTPTSRLPGGAGPTGTYKK